MMGRVDKVWHVRKKRKWGAKQTTMRAKDRLVYATGTSYVPTARASKLFPSFLQHSTADVQSGPVPLAAVYWIPTALVNDTASPPTMVSARSAHPQRTVPNRPPRLARLLG